MKRPNEIDWMVYRFFRWWWSPILVGNAQMCVAVAVWMCVWIKHQWGIKLLDPKYYEEDESASGGQS